MLHSIVIILMDRLEGWPLDLDEIVEAWVRALRLLTLLLCEGGRKGSPRLGSPSSVAPDSASLSSLLLSLSLSLFSRLALSFRMIARCSLIVSSI